MWFHKLVATSLGIGYINKGKGAGTAAAVACCFVWWLCWRGGYPPLISSVTITIFILLIGVWSSNIIVGAKIWKDENDPNDPHRVVIDEVAGMCVSLLFVPDTIIYCAIALGLFRLFDIYKPFWIKKMEKLPGGWGIMMDDVLAGIYTNILLQIVVYFKLLG